MRGRDVLRLASSHVRNRGLRSGLTVLGVIIGVAAVVALISLGEGFRQGFEQQLSGLGGQDILVTPGFNRADDPFSGLPPAAVGNLTERDVEAVDSVPGVVVAHGVVSERLPVTYRGEQARLTVEGVEPSAWAATNDADLREGRLLVPGDANAAVVGSGVADGIFGNEVAVNQPIVVDGTTFRVVGVMDPAGFFGAEDSTVVVPRDALRRVLGQPGSTEVTSIEAEAGAQEDVSEVAADVERALLQRRHLTADEKDFTILTGEEIQAEVDAILQSFTVFLGGIAAISLLVGGIGIANTMFMAVLERSRQVGILKALGSTNGDVARLFLVEAVLLGLIGGAAGLGVGVAISYLVSSLGVQGFGPPGQPPLRLVVTPTLAVAAVAFALVVGAVSGLVPALRAARLQPVETLRGE